MSVVIETTVGDITVDLYLKERPKTCMNFLKLCQIKYYNLCLFHKIEKNFIAQTGDPSGTGRGGESVFCHLYGDQAKYFEAEFKPRLKHEKLGTLSMVNNGNNMNGSQFFLTLSDNLTYLDENHTVFGEVAEGFDVLLKLNDAICDNSNRPYQDIRITHTVILHDPFEDPKDLEIPDRSPEPTKEMLESAYIGADEEIDDNKGKTAEEIEEKIKESEAKARATILEMVGDIPEADVKPPENVLFICKLNPVTTSEDLEIIFSRFGHIVNCEVVKDKTSGESLQYAFIEFEKEDDCENAFFKMDNVLIDDRRIHVDFSQSVSKINWSKKSNKRFERQNIVLKNSSKRNDGYDLIFNSKNSDISSDERNHITKSKNSDFKSKSGSRYKHTIRNEMSFSSRSDERKQRNEKKDYNYNYQQHKNIKYDKYSEKEERRKYREHEYYYTSDKNRDYNRHRNEMSRPSSKSPSRSKRNSDSSRSKGISDSSRSKGNSDSSRSKGNSDSSRSKGNSDSFRSKGNSDSSRSKGNSDSSRSKGNSDSSSSKGNSDSYRSKRNPEYRKSSPEFSSKKDKSSEKKRYDSVSPDRHRYKKSCHRH